MNHLFSHKKNYKHIGFVIIVVIVVLMILSHVKVQSVSEHKAQQQNMANEYNISSEKQSSDKITSNAVEEVTNPMNNQDDSSLEGSKQLNNDDNNNVNNGSNDSNGQNTDGGQNNFITNDGSDNAFINSNQEFAGNSSKTADDQIDSDKKYVTCSIQITCEALRNHMDQWSNQSKDKDAVVPQDYTYLKMVNITVAEGSSVYDALMKAAAQYDINVITKSDYIISINQLAEKDVGKWSGWMYKVNGNSPKTGCSTCYVNDNDVILWYYVI